VAIGARIVPARVLDVSYGGCRVELGEPIPEGSIVCGAAAVLDVALVREASAWQSLPITVNRSFPGAAGLTLGVSFGKLRRRQYRAVADMMYGDAEEILRFRSQRRRRHGILFGVGKFLAWGLVGTLRGFALQRALWLGSRTAKPAAPSASPPHDLTAPPPGDARLGAAA